MAAQDGGGGGWWWVVVVVEEVGGDLQRMWECRSRSPRARPLGGLGAAMEQNFSFPACSDQSKQRLWERNSIFPEHTQGRETLVETRLTDAASLSSCEGSRRGSRWCGFAGRRARRLRHLPSVAAESLQLSALRQTPILPLE